MAFKFYIDNLLVDQPIGDLDLLTKIKRDDRVGGITIEQAVTLSWTKENALPANTTSGYIYLKSLFDDFICNEATIDIYDEVAPTETYLTFTGIIKLPQIEFSEQPVSLSIKVQDNSFYSYIYNNRDLKVDLRAVNTKNKLTTTEIEWYKVDMFNGATGGFGSGIGAYYKGYLITDVFEFIVRVITDEKVGFASNYLDSLTYPLMLFKGESLLSPYTLYPSSNPVFEISFQQLYDEINKLKNVYFYIDATDPDAPILRLENTEATYSSYAGITFTEPPHVKTSVDTTNLYGKVSLGSLVTVDGYDPAIYTMNESISYYGFKLEDVFPLGQCNNNTDLRLVNDWVVSNNVIQDILVGSSAIYNDNYILVEVDGVDTVGLTANGYPWTFFGQPTPPWFYNLGLNNFSKLQRHSDKFETIFGNFLGLGTDGFRALLGDNAASDITYVTVPSTDPNFIPPGGITVNPAPYVNETTNGGFDGNNNYNNVTFRYTVPQDGNYSFHHFMKADVDGVQTFETFQVTLRIYLYDSLLNLKATQIGGFSTVGNGFFQGDAVLVCDAIATDIVLTEYTIEYFPNQGGSQNIARTLAVTWESYFECNGTPDGGVSIAAGNASIKKLLHEFDYHISETNWRTIAANPTGMYPLIKDGLTRYCWIVDMSHPNQNGMTRIKLRSSNATT